MKAFLVNYNYTPTWLLESGLDWHISDRSDSKEYLKDFPQERITYEENVGQVDFPKLNYLIDNYHSLPDVFLWGKTNLFAKDKQGRTKFITEEEYEKVKDNKFFTPLLTKNHQTRVENGMPICYYAQDIYYEINNDWYVPSFPYQYFASFNDFALEMGLPRPAYIPFAPGGNYILTRTKVHEFSRDFYEKMASFLPYCAEPVEAQFCERSYYLMWQ